MGVASPADLIGKSDFDFWSEQTANEAAADEKRIMETGQPLIGKVEQVGLSERAGRLGLHH